MASDTPAEPTPAESLRFALLLDGKGGGRRLTLDDVRSWRPQHGALWVHLDPCNAEDRAWLEKESRLPEADKDALASQRARVRVEVTGPNSLLCVLNVTGPIYPSVEHTDQPHAVRVWVDPDRLITCAEPPRPVLEAHRLRLEVGEGARSTSELLRELVRAGLARGEANAIDLDEGIAAIERAMDLDQPVSSEDLRHVRLRGISIRAGIAPLRDFLVKLRQADPPWLREESGRLREMINEAAQQVETIDALMRRADIAMSHLEQRSLARTQRAVYIITLLTGLFVPFSAITSLLGVNVGGVPGKENPYGFIILCVALAVCLFISWRIVQRKHWV